jgi:hypothetical protein
MRRTPCRGRRWPVRPRELTPEPTSCPSAEPAATGAAPPAVFARALAVGPHGASSSPSPIRGVSVSGARAIWRTSIVRRSNIRLGDGDHRPLRAARFDTVRAEGLLGLRTPSGELAGVAVFTRWPVPESGDLYGPEHRNLVVCLTRGACVHWAHPQAASFLISRACSRQKSSSAGRFSTAMPTQLAGELFRIDPTGSPRVGASAVVMRQRSCSGAQTR